MAKLHSDFALHQFLRLHAASAIITIHVPAFAGFLCTFSFYRRYASSIQCTMDEIYYALF